MTRTVELYYDHFSGRSVRVSAVHAAEFESLRSAAKSAKTPAEARAVIVANNRLFDKMKA